MTLPTSGQISLADVKAEFGGNASPKITDYYAGGAFVPSGATGTLGAVPSSGQISLQNFWGTSAFTPHSDTFTGDNLSGTVPVPSGAVTLVIEVWARAGDGGNGATGSDDHQGGGGGMGGYAKYSISLSGDAGKNVSYNTGNLSTAATVTATLTNGSPSLTANPGATGFTATGTTNGAGRPGGTASGGNVTNATGASGAGGNTGGTGGQGGGANNGYGLGGDGGFSGSNNGKTNGTVGRIKLTWS